MVNKQFRCLFPLFLFIDRLVVSFFKTFQGMDSLNWMTKLPEKAKNKSLVDLAIPGSHDSGAWYLNKNGPLSPDQSHIFKYFKNVVYNWSVTQDYDFTDQLALGIRYFDIRIAPLPQSGELCVVHGLYGHTIKSQLSKIVEFLNDHSKEIVLLDFQHCLGFSEDQHIQLIDLITKTFGEKLVSCKDRDIKSLSVNSLNSEGKQIVAIYHHKNDSSFMWPGEDIYSPWPNLQSSDAVLKSITTELQKRPKNKLFVSQAVMTPDANIILKHVNGNLRSWQKDLFKNLKVWLKSYLADDVNIVICDSVDKDYAGIIIQSNYN